MFRISFAASLFLASLSGAVLAGDTAPSVVVPYADLDLAKPAGQEQLDRRVRNAALSLCPTGALALRDRLETIRCRQLAQAEAAAQVREAVAAAKGASIPERFAGTEGTPKS